MILSVSGGGNNKPSAEDSEKEYYKQKTHQIVSEINNRHKQHMEKNFNH